MSFHRLIGLKYPPFSIAHIDFKSLLVQGDLPNEWFPAMKWQQDFLKKVMPELVSMQRASHQMGVVFTSSVQHGRYTYTIGNGGPHELMLVNIETGKTRKLWYPPPPPDHGGALTKSSGAYFSYK